jgi:ABC-type bacteriocin/lantibiotic exporter with double-glycine peptidase domain
MSNDLLDILSNSNDKINNQKLIDYLNDNLSDKEKHEVEKWMSDNDMVNDAVEGLQHVKNKKNLQAYVEQLNKNLQNQLEQKKQQQKKRKLKEYPWIYFAIVLILLLCIIGYIIIRKFLHTGGF